MYAEPGRHNRPAGPPALPYTTGQITVMTIGRPENSAITVIWPFVAWSGGGGAWRGLVGGVARVGRGSEIRPDKAGWPERTPGM
jgi:hypothetical protein